MIAEKNDGWRLQFFRALRRERMKVFRRQKCWSAYESNVRTLLEDHLSMRISPSYVDVRERILIDVRGGEVL